MRKKKGNINKERGTNDWPGRYRQHRRLSKGGWGEREGAVETNESIDEVDDSVTKAVVWPAAWLTSISL